MSVVDEDNVKIHYKGYSKRHDEVRPKKDVVNLRGQPEGEASPEESFVRFVKFKIRGALKRPRENPSVKLRFEVTPAQAREARKTGFMRNVLEDPYVILNQNGDFCFVYQKTLKISCRKQGAFVDFLRDGQKRVSDVPGFVLTIAFTRGDDVLKNLDTKPWIQ